MSETFLGIDFKKVKAAFSGLGFGFDTDSTQVQTDESKIEVLEQKDSISPKSLTEKGDVRSPRPLS